MVSTVSAESLSRELRDIKGRTEELISGLAPEQLGQRPETDTWCIAECLDHLNLTARVVQPMIERSVERGRQQQITGTGPFAPGAMGAFLTWFAEPPPKLRVGATKHVAPRCMEAGDICRVVPEFWRFHAEWERLVRASDGLDLARITTRPIRRAPVCRLAGTFSWMLAHERRHLLQAENVRKSL